jgi:NitT/TauT family transport system substrate-binding protein
LNQAIDYINNNLDEAVELLAPIYGIDEETLREQMTYRGTIYSNELTGLDKLAKEMYRIGFLKNPIRFEDVVFEKAGKDFEEGTREE